MNKNFHNGHKYSVAEIAAMRKAVYKILDYQVCHIFVGDYEWCPYPIRSPSPKDCEVEDSLRTYMLNGSTVKELDEAVLAAKQKYLDLQEKARQDQIKWDAKVAENKVKAEKQKAEKEAEFVRKNTYDSSNWCGHPEREQPRPNTPWWKLW